MMADRFSAPLRTVTRDRLGLGAVTLILAGLTVATSLLSGETPLRLDGAFLVLAGALELLHSLRRVAPDDRRVADPASGRGNLPQVGPGCVIRRALTSATW